VLVSEPSQQNYDLPGKPHMSRKKHFASIRPRLTIVFTQTEIDMRIHLMKYDRAVLACLLAIIAQLFHNPPRFHSVRKSISF
jgi:hypothetical protein